MYASTNGNILALLAHWSAGRKRNRVSSVQLRRSVRDSVLNFLYSLQHSSFLNRLLGKRGEFVTAAKTIRYVNRDPQVLL